MSREGIQNLYITRTYTHVRWIICLFSNIKEGEAVISVILWCGTLGWFELPDDDQIVPAIEERFVWSNMCPHRRILVFLFKLMYAHRHLWICYTLSFYTYSLYWTNGFTGMISIRNRSNFWYNFSLKIRTKSSLKLKSNGMKSILKV